MSELTRAEMLPVIDGEIVGEEVAIQYSSEDNLKASRNFFQAVVEDPELLAVAATAVARHISPSRPSTEIVVRKTPDTRVVRIARPPLVLPNRQLAMSKSTYKPFVTPLKSLANDTGMAILKANDRLNELNERFGALDSTPYYLKSFDMTKRAIATAKPLLASTKSAVETKVSAMSEVKRRRLVATAVAGLAFSCVVTGTFAADVKGRASESVQVNDQKEEGQTNVFEPSKAQIPATIQQLISTGDKDNG
ncbi:hypothetical protein H7Y63_00140 [Polaromonas sp.]|nr:hypothetical protein [Candidatus Saccharibacteria bacterium]